MERDFERKLEKDREVTGTAIFTNFPTKPPPKELPEHEKNTEPYQPVPPDRPRFVVAYARGMMQLMRSLNDPGKCR